MGTISAQNGWEDPFACENQGEHTVRFVLLEHHERATGRHFDLMIERPGEEFLETWRLPAPPTLGLQAAERISPHRKLYLTYDGPVIPDRGWVRAWDRGNYELLHDRDGFVRLKLAGERGTGILELKGDADDESAVWAYRWLAYQPRNIGTPSFIADRFTQA